MQTIHREVAGGVASSSADATVAVPQPGSTDRSADSRLLLSCDWGTSHLRVRLVDTASGAIVSEVSSAQGVGHIAAQTAPEARREAFRQTLAEAVEELSRQTEGDLLGLPLFVSGMASSSIGWHELPYAPLPFALDGRGLVWHSLEPLCPRGGSVLLISGVRDRADVMRGEETEIVGLSRLPIADVLQSEAVVILPGTHSKHVVVQEGQVTSFQTFMTGELFEVLRCHSSLQHSTAPPTGSGKHAADAAMDGDATDDEASKEEAFVAGVRQVAEHPLTASLFQVRARQLLHKGSLEANTAYLSGLLIGAELRDLCRSTTKKPLILAAGSSLARPYELALRTLGLSARLQVVPPDDVHRLSANGHLCLWRRGLVPSIV